MGYRFTGAVAMAVVLSQAAPLTAEKPHDPLTATLTDGQVRELFFDAYPELRERWEQLSAWDQVRYLRTWTWSWVDVAFDPHLYPSLGNNALETIKLFAKDCGGVWCGGAATSLIQVYRDFGFEAHQLGFSMVPPAVEWGGHVVTLVRIKDRNGQPIWSLQDAYFNSCLADDDGDPIDYVEFLTRLKARELDQVKVLEMEMPVKAWPTVVIPPDRSRGRDLEQLPHEYWPVDLDAYRIEGKPGDWVKIYSPRTSKLYEGRFYYFKEILQANGLQPDSRFAFLYASQTFDGPKEFLNRIHSVREEEPLKPLSHGKYKVWFSSAGYREIPWRWASLTTENKAATLVVESPGTHTVHVWMGEPRVPIDQLVFTQHPRATARRIDLEESDAERIVVEAEEPAENVRRTPCYWVLCDRQSQHHGGRGFMVSQPRRFSFDRETCPDKSPELRYKVDFPRAGIWHVCVRTNTVIPPNDLIHIGMNGKPLFSMELSKR